MQKTIKILKNKTEKINLQLDAEEMYELEFILSENAYINLFLAIKSEQTQKYNLRIRVIHKAPNSKSNIHMNAVLYDESEIKMYGSISVENGNYDVDASLKQKVVLMSEKAKIVLDPVLEIDENRLTGSHAAVISSPNPDHIYYLQSRGMDEVQARETLVQGLLNIPDGYSTMEL